MTERVCGTYSSYGHGCRCDPCRDAGRAYHRDHYQKNRADYIERAAAWKRDNPIQAAAIAARFAELTPAKAAAYQKKYRDNHPVMESDRSLMSRYGMTAADRDEMLAGQGGVCPICGEDAPRGSGWHIDHCHASGRVRGVLCGMCNPGLGYFQDRPEWLRSAADYLENSLDEGDQ